VLGRDFRYFPPYYRRDYPPFENDDRCQARYQYVNLDLATLFGGDLFAEAKLSDTFAVFGSMAYVCGTNQSPMAFYATSWKAQEGYLIRYGGTDGLPGIYPLCGTLGCRWTAPDDDRWMVEFSSQLVAPQNHVAVVLSELPSPGFVVFNLRGYYRVRKNVRVTLDLRNLLNTDYAEPGSLFYKDLSGNIAPVKEPGFAAVLGVDARF
jgi:outer membrane receptor protein involved in Fe transport